MVVLTREQLEDAAGCVASSQSGVGEQPIARDSAGTHRKSGS